MWSALKTRPLPDPETVTTLDVEDARDIVLRCDDTLFFFELTKISEAVASILVRYGDDLWLGKLASLTPGVASVLARHRHNLILDGLTDITPQTARLLAAHGRKQFDASLRRARKNHERWLEAIRRLSSGKGAARRAALGDALRFGSLEQNDWRLLSLSGLQSLPPDVARELASHRGALLLSGVQSLSDEAASELSAHAGLLALDGLTSLSRAAAASLASCSRWKPDWILACSSLQLAGLEALSPVVAAELAAFDGDLNLSGVTDLPTPVAAALASHRPTNVARRTLVLDGLKHLSVAAAEALTPHTGELLLEGLTEISPELADPLSRHRGRVFLGGVQQLSTAAASVLLSSPQVHLVADPRCL
jgi:hypothetical protein